MGRGNPCNLTSLPKRVKPSESDVTDFETTACGFNNGKNNEVKLAVVLLDARHPSRRQSAAAAHESG